jgi:Zn-dependent protease
MDVNIQQLIGHLIIYIVVFLFAISIHEAAHAWVSHRWGDDTAYRLGRVTLNPVAHTDPIGTLLLPIIGFIAGWGGAVVPLMAWGKPTPVNPLKWTNLKWGNVCVSVAGVTANFIVVIIVFAILKYLFISGTVDENYFIDLVSKKSTGELTLMTPVLLLLWYSITLNLSLVIFNLLPFPPLDGSGILSSLLPDSFQPIFDMMEQYGFLILLLLIMSGITGKIMSPFFEILFYFLFN